MGWMGWVFLTELGFAVTVKIDFCLSQDVLEVA